MSLTTLRIFAVLASILLSFSKVSAQSGPPVHQAKPRSLGPAKWIPSHQEVSTVYWTLEPGWNTELEMRNNLTFHELTVTPVLRTPSGRETALPPVTIPPRHIVSLDLRNAAQVAPEILGQVAADHAGSYGSAVFRFDGLDSANLFAATIVHRIGRPIDFHFDVTDAGTGYSSGGIEGMWWLPTAASTDYLILSNPAPKAVTGSLVLSGASGAASSLPVRIGPGQTNRIDLRDALGPLGSQVMGGLSLSLPGKESISATQIAFDDATGLTAIMRLFDREPDDKSRNHALIAPMMALSQPDPTLGFPSGTTLIPRVFLRNAGTAPIQLSAYINWRGDGSLGSFPFSHLTLSPGEVRVITLTDYQKPGQIPLDAIWGTMSLAYTGRSGDLVAIAISYDKTSRYGLQTPFRETLARLWAGGMWHVDETHNTLITTGNGGSDATEAEVTLFYNGGKGRYRMEQRLSAGQQMWIDVGHLVRDQVPDLDGHILPPDTMNGSYELRDVDHPLVGQLFEGKLVIDKTYGHASYGCGSCCGYSIPLFDPDDFGGPPDDDYTEIIDSTEQCGGGLVDLASSAYNWKSTNTAVATLPSMYLHTVAPGTATGQSELYLQAAHPAPLCPMVYYYPNQGLNVNTVSQSPLTLNMSNGDTSDAINVTVSGPAGVLVFSSGLTSNPNSTTAATVSIPGNNSFTGNANFTISVSPGAGSPNSPSGIFYATACVGQACSQQGTTINIPPQVLIQMMQAEAGGTNSTAMTADGDVARNRMSSSYFDTQFNTYQNTIVTGQFAIGSATTGIQPELNSAVSVFTSTGGNFCGSLAFWTPTSSQWSTVQTAINSATTTFPSGTGAPTYSAWQPPQQQILYVSTVGTQGNGAPNFLYLATRNSSQPAAVNTSCTP